MIRNQKSGFSVIEIIISIAVLGGIALAVWYAITLHNRSSAIAPTAKPATTQAGIVLGLDTPTSNDAKAISQLGKTPALIDAFYQWQDPNNNYVNYPQTWVDSIVKLGSTPMITWEPSAGGNSTEGNSKSQTNFNLATILSGKYDGFIRQWAVAAKADNQTLYVRLMHEMNDSGYAWGSGVNGNTPTQYVAAFQHVVGIFQTVGANKVQFIWCIGANKLTPNPSVFYPGNNYVSWVSIDGYNRNKPWNSFATIFSQAYQDITAISNRPVLIAETASVEDPNNPQAKADWITTAFTQTIPNQFPRIKAINYFDSNGNGYSYPIDSSSTTLSAIKAVYASPLYQATAPATTLSY